MNLKLVFFSALLNVAGISEYQNQLLYQIVRLETDRLLSELRHEVSPSLLDEEEEEKEESEEKDSNEDDSEEPEFDYSSSDLIVFDYLGVTIFYFI